MKKNINNQLYNIVSENLTVKQIIKKIQKHKKIKIKLVNEKIMNQLSYKTKSVKIQKMGLKLDCKLQEDINMTFKLLKKKSFTNGKT